MGLFSSQGAFPPDSILRIVIRRGGVGSTTLRNSHPSVRVRIRDNPGRHLSRGQLQDYCRMIFFFFFQIARGLITGKHLLGRDNGFELSSRLNPRFFISITIVPETISYFSSSVPRQLNEGQIRWKVSFERRSTTPLLVAGASHEMIRERERESRGKGLAVKLSKPRVSSCSFPRR